MSAVIQSNSILTLVFNQNAAALDVDATFSPTNDTTWTTVNICTNGLWQTHRPFLRPAKLFNRWKATRAKVPCIGSSELFPPALNGPVASVSMSVYFEAQS